MFSEIEYGKCVCTISEMGNGMQSTGIFTYICNDTEEIIVAIHRINNDILFHSYCECQFKMEFSVGLFSFFSLFLASLRSSFLIGQFDELLVSTVNALM